MSTMYIMSIVKAKDTNIKIWTLMFEFQATKLFNIFAIEIKYLTFVHDLFSRCFYTNLTV